MSVPIAYLNTANMPVPEPYSDSPDGLSKAEAERRLQLDGPNELPQDNKRNLPAIVREVLGEPMFLLLLAAGAVYLLLGDATDALMLLGFVCLMIFITVWQEYKTEHVLEALRDLSSPRALVRRDGVERRVAGREVVAGDILLLEEGDRVAADALILDQNDFAADESLLTGESVPVRKIAAHSHPDYQAPGGDDSPFVYSGTLVVQGRATARVIATGPRTEIGKIGQSLQTLDVESTPLQRETARLVKTIALIGVTLSLLLAFLHIRTNGDWLHGLLAGITLAMSLLPEEYPVVLTIFLAMGAWRIAKHQVLTRRIPAVEALGSATVLCVDKTGTLTENRMTLRQLVTPDAAFDTQNAELPEAFHTLLEFAVLASETAPFDPMEVAIHQTGKRYLVNSEHLHDDWDLVHEYSLSPQLLALSHVWRAHNSDVHIVAAKGAPEAIADLCHLPADAQTKLARQIEQLAEQGMRVLGVAKATFTGTNWPQGQHDFDFQFLGLLGLSDPLRPTAAGAVEECRKAGIRVMMITGDYPATAAAIAHEAGLDTAQRQIVTGQELESLDDDALRNAVRTCNVFARVVPQQKLRLVDALKANGEIVAMTGDGVNDAAALKAAHIGIAMGQRGTDVAREAASLVLLDDDFASIVRAIRLGRTIFDNLRKAMAYLFAAHLPIAGLSLIPLLLGWPLVFEPVHILFLEMIINPACSIVFEAEAADRNVMQRPPRRPDEPLFGRSMLLLGMLQGCTVMVAGLFALGYAQHYDLAAPVARSMAFVTLVAGNLGLILVNRSWQYTLLGMLHLHNPALWWITASALLFLGGAVYLPALAAIFHFAPLGFATFLTCLALGFGSVLWFELAKLLRTR
ncbi:MAG: cation-translocating P-type ATPase [Pseudomonadota bacterium]